LPKYKQWIQVDVGISFAGKRKFRESIQDALIREAREEIHIRFRDSEIYELAKEPFTKTLYYGCEKNKKSCLGFEIYIFEVLFPDQIELCDENISQEFCKCEERKKIISSRK
jgi:8-oxo-dGTP pyrophosphatase MutT (NUDIX family)